MDKESTKTRRGMLAKRDLRDHPSRPLAIARRGKAANQRDSNVSTETATLAVMFRQALLDNGGQDFVTRWAGNRPSDFFKAYSQIEQKLTITGDNGGPITFTWIHPDSQEEPGD